MPVYMNNEFKEVRFDKYCKTCEYEKTKDVDDPCNECLENPANLHSQKPVNFKEKQD